MATKKNEEFYYIKELAVLRRVGASLRAWKPFTGV
jgi:cobyrinic acid a,c-diamide synthase